MTETESEYKTLTEDEFKAEGTRRFGEDEFQWKFRCPICGNIQSAEDFRKYKNVGAKPGSAYQECIGRYLPDSFRAFGTNKKGAKKSPCDYASYGLFNIGNRVKLANGEEVIAFPFADRPT